MFRRFVIALSLVSLFTGAVLAYADAPQPVTLGQGKLTTIALSPDGSRLAAGTTLGVSFYDAYTFEPQGGWETGYPVQTLAWTPQGNVLVGNDYSVELRAVDTGAVALKINKCWNCVPAFTTDGTQVALVDWFGAATVYELATGAKVEVAGVGGFWPLADWQVTHLAPFNYQSADGKVVIVNRARGEWQGAWAFVYDVANRALLNQAPMWSNGGWDWLASRAALSPNGQWLATSDPDKIQIWAVGEAEARLTLYGHHKGYAFHRFAWSPDSTVLYSALNNEIYVWDIATGRALRSLSGFTAEVNQVLWSSDGQRVIAAQGQHLGAWDLASRQPSQVGWLNDSARGAWGWSTVSEIVASPRGDIVAVADNAGVTLHDAVTLTAIRRLQVGRRVVAVAFSPDGRWVATGGNGGYVNLWETATGRPARDLIGESNFIAALTFSVDGQTLYVLEGNGLLHRWNITTLALDTVQTAPPQPNYYYDPAIHPQAERVATERGGDGIDVSDTTTGQRLYNIPVRGAQSIQINSAGTRLAAIVNGKAYIWDLATGTQLAEYSARNADWWTARVTDVAFSPDGTQLAVSNYNGTVAIWPVP